MNKFLQKTTSSNTFTENGAVSNSSSGDLVLDYFFKSGGYRGRAQAEVDASFSSAYHSDKLKAMKVAFYNRMVTRKISYFSDKGTITSDNVQRGQGNRDEFRKCMVYVLNNDPAVFYKNMHLIPAIGCWKDLWHKDILKHIDRSHLVNFVYNVILSDTKETDLLKKYLPKIRSSTKINSLKEIEDRKYYTLLNSFIRTLILKLGWTEKKYRVYKSSGHSHDFQKLMCSNKWKLINFKKIPGKALFMMAKTRKNKPSVIESHGLTDKYLSWLDTQPTAKFTGYVYELGKQAMQPGNSRVTLNTINKQFDGLIELAKKDNTGGLSGNVWCALDTSGSMGLQVDGTSGVSAKDVCVSLGIYFSTLNTGAFKDHVIMFDDYSKAVKLSGNFTDKIMQIPRNAMGGTNFQSVIDEIVRLRTDYPGIPVEDFPTTLLVVSDMQFNPTGSKSTNYEKAMKKLRAVGLPDMKIIWWLVSQRIKDVPSTIEDRGTTLLSGFDGAVISLILGGQQEKVVNGQVVQLSPLEQMDKALDQEVLHQIVV